MKRKLDIAKYESAAEAALGALVRPRLSVSLLAAIFTITLIQTSDVWADRGVRLIGETSRPNTSTFSVGEPVKASFIATGLHPGQATDLAIEIRNEFNAVIAKYQPFTLTATAFGQAKFVLDLPSQQLGYYEVRGHLSDGTTFPKTGSRPAGIFSYAIVPDPQERVSYPASKTRFGLQGGFNSKAVVLPYLGARWLIRGGFDWAALEPDHPGQFFAESREVSPIRDGTYPLVFKGKRWETYVLAPVTKASLPRWAGKSGTFGTINKGFGALNTKGAESLSRFSYEFAKRFANDFPDQDVRYYQVTWEPNNGWSFRGTSEELVEIYRLVYSAVHKADPRASVTGPTVHLDPASTAQLSDLWKAGLHLYIDAISTHAKAKWPPEAHELPKVLRAQLQEARNKAGHEIPFLGTEQGYRSAEIGLLGKALGDIRSALIMLGEGALTNIGFYVHDFGKEEEASDTLSYGFYWNLNPGIRFGSDKLGPKPIVPAFAAMTFFLDGSTSEGSLPGLMGAQVGYRFVVDGQRVDVIWDYERESKYTIQEGQKVCDWMGNCSIWKGEHFFVGRFPIYIMDK